MDRPRINVVGKTAALDLLIDASSFWERLEADVAAASKRIYIQTLSFEGDRAGKMLGDSVRASSAADKRIIVDYYTKYVLSDKFRYSPKNWFDRELKSERLATSLMMDDLNCDGTRVRFVNPVGLFMVRMAARNHKKIIVIDDAVSYIGGINFSDHNFSWHDLMVRIENREVAEFLAEDFLSTWGGSRFSGRFRSGDIELFSFDGRSNHRAFEPILNLIRSAESSIYVQSPYLSFPFTDAMRDAACRGVAVTVVTPEKNNKKTLRDYIHWEAARSGFDLRLYRDGMTHLKAMLIDDAYLIVGSSNFDCFSYDFEEETVAVISDRELITGFKEQVVHADHASSSSADLTGRRVRGAIRHLQLKFSAQVMRLFN